MFASPMQISTNSDLDTPSPSRAMAKRSAATANEPVITKEFVVRTYSEIDTTLFSVKQRGSLKNGDPFFQASYDHSHLVINLTPENWLHLPFSIDTKDRYAMDGKGDLHTFTTNVEVTPDIAKVITDIEAIVEEQVKATIPGVEWHNSVRKSGEHGERFAAKLVSKADDDKHNTLCTVRLFGKQPVKGAGPDFLTPLLEANRGFRNAKVKVAVAFHKVWVMTDKYGKKSAGVNWRITNFVADVPEQVQFVYQDIFANELVDEQ